MAPQVLATQRRPSRRLSHGLALIAAIAAVALGSRAGLAQESWNPFRNADEQPRRVRPTPPPEASPPDRSTAPDSPRYQEPWRQNPAGPPLTGTTVERVELEPLAPPPGLPVEPATPAPSGVGRRDAPPVVRQSADADPLNRPDLWRGLDMARLEPLIAGLDIPPRAASMNALWRRLFMATATPPEGTQGPAHFPALQLEALYRSGQLDAMTTRLVAAGGTPGDALLAGFQIRRDLALGDREAACGRARDLLARRSGLPKLLAGEAHVLSGYCAAVDGNVKGAGLAADLAREAEVEAPLALQLLDFIGQGAQGPKPKLAWPKRLLVLEYRLLELAGLVEPAQVLAAAEPALLVALARDPGTEPRLAIAAAEAAAGLQALSADELAAAYARVAIPAQADPLFRRAALFRQIGAERDPARRSPLAQTLLEDARRSGLATIMAAALAPFVPLPETLLAVGDVSTLRTIATGANRPWLALAELTDPFAPSLSELALTALEEAAARGRFTPDGLHRLVAVLDAMDINVPLPLWEAANRAPQPTSGYLPETGVLPRLAEAAKRGEVGHTALLTLKTLGPGGPASAQLIALGDAIRALRRVGLASEARAVAIDALLPSWPR